MPNCFGKTCGASIVLSQWETALLCNDVSHWLDTMPQFPLIVYIHGKVRRFEASYVCFTHWGWDIIGSNNGLSPGRRQAIISTNAGILLTRTLGTNFSEILSEIHTFSFKKRPLKMTSGEWWPVCLGLNVLSKTCGVSTIPINCLHPWQGQEIWGKPCLFKQHMPVCLLQQSVGAMVCEMTQKLRGAFIIQRFIFQFNPRCAALFWGNIMNIFYHFSLHGIVELINTLGPRQNGHHFPDAIFQCIFIHENV